MVCVFPFVRAPCRAGGCGGWEPTCQSSPLGQGQAVGLVPQHQAHQRASTRIPITWRSISAKPWRRSQESACSVGARIRVQRLIN